MTNSDDFTVLHEKPLSDAIVKLEELFSQSCRAFLIGAGCSKSAGIPLTGELTALVLESNDLDVATKEILSAVAQPFDGKPSANIEDYLSELIDLLAIAERRELRKASPQTVTLQEVHYSSETLRRAVDQIKKCIATVIDCEIDSESKIRTHRNFVKAVHRPLRPGKSMSNQAVDYLVLNYDTLLETALALERISFADGLDGGVTAWWNPATFDREDLAARVLKLHGSINWYGFPDESLPRRLAPSFRPKPALARVLIWPASTKYRETQLDPYAQLAERARQILRPDLTSPRVLLVCGYSFGDSHINLEISRALRESKGNLTVLIFTSENEPPPAVEEWRQDTSIMEQVLIFAKRGFFHARSIHRTDHDLPWWKFENITRLLGGER